MAQVYVYQIIYFDGKGDLWYGDSHAISGDVLTIRHEENDETIIIPLAQVKSIFITKDEEQEEEQEQEQEMSSILQPIHDLLTGKSSLKQ